MPPADHTTPLRSPGSPWRHLLPVPAAIGLAVTLFAAIVPLAGLGWIRPDPALRNPDRAGFDWKRNAAREPGNAVAVLSGDSACATAVDPTLDVAGAWRSRMLNLGLIIDLPLSAYAEALQSAVSAANGRSRVAVLIVSPQRLAHVVSGPYFADLWAGREPIDTSPPTLPGLAASARSLWRACPPFRLLEVPLRGDGRAVYGFPSGVRDYVDRHRGSFLDPGEYRRSHRESVEALLPHPGLEAEIGNFRAAWRNEVPLLVALAPIPESYAPNGFQDQRNEVLNRFARALGAEGTLSDLPASLPDPLFASPTHLNSAGQRWYTRAFAMALSRHAQATP